MLNGARLHEASADALRAAFDRVLESGRFIGGQEVANFENVLAEQLNVSYAVGTSSGTDALTVALSALGVRPGDEVITTAYSFIAAAAAVARLGAKPVFVDIDPATFNIDPSGIPAAFTSRTAGVLPVHLFGQCADMPPILDVASKEGIWVLEDTAQSIGAPLNGRMAGTMGTVGTLSFFPAKNLGALGDAGALVTDDAGLAERIRLRCNHGSAERYLHEELGGNCRLDALQAAFLKVKLQRLPEWQKARRRIAEAYRQELAGTGDLVLPADRTDGGHVYNQFVIRTERRDVLRSALQNADIETAIHYPMPLPFQPCFAELGHKPGSFPNAARASDETLALPMDPLLTESEQLLVIDTIKAVYG